MTAHTMYRTLIQTFITCLLALGLCHGAGTQADYDRAAALRSQTRDKVFGQNLEPHWLAGGERFWYTIQTGPDSRKYVLVDAEKGTRQPVFDHAKLAAALRQAGLENASKDQLSLEKFEIDETGLRATFQVGDKLFEYDLQTHECRQTGTAPVETLTPYSPEGAPVVSRSGGRDTRVTFINRTEQTVTLFWLDTSGGRVNYGTLKPGQQHAQHTFAGHLWLIVGEDDQPICVYRATRKKAQAVIGAAEPQPYSSRRNNRGRSTERDKPDRAVSPDGRWRVSIQDHNVLITDSDGEETTTLTRDGTDKDGYIQRFFWSPDSTKLIVLRQHKGQEHKVHFIESSPADQVQPKLHSFDYHKPGDIIDIERPCLFDIETKTQIPVDNAIFSNPFNIMDYQWCSDSSEFMFVYNQRGHQVLRVVGIDAVTGRARSIVDETSETFICYSRNYFFRYLSDTREIIWMSERDGWNHLYLYDANTGSVKNKITKGQWVVRDVRHVDPQKRQIWFTAGGVYPEQDPYYLHYCRVNFDGGGFTILTEGNGTHSVQLSPNRAFFIDTYSRVNLPPVHELRRSDTGKRICELERADWTGLLDTGWQVPETFVAKGRDGRTDIYGVIYRPTNLDPNQSYPVIEQIYAGPHGHHVPKEFRPFYGAQELAELGFITVQIDGMGTNHRSKAFHDVCWKNLADAGLPDRVLWIKAAAKTHPYMDVSRVGIFGGSAGGQNAAGALLTHGDFYSVGVADCGCHDNRMDKIWWNEQWMGWPVGPAYEANSNVTLAKNLRGKLFLIVGEMDRNVDPASTMQVVNALIKADKDFDLLVVPGGGHGVGGGAYGKRRQADFFVRHLLGVEPPPRN